MTGFLVALLLLSGLWLAASAAALAADASLRVEITGLHPAAGGQLRVGLFVGEQDWPKLQQAQRLEVREVTAEQLALRFDGLELRDDYAIEVHHDENGNGKFDMRWFPYPRPKEGVGVSNNHFGFGHPDFSAARFSLNRDDQLIRIRMRY